MAVIDVRVDGLADLERQLLRLGAAVGAKVLRGALSDALKPMQKAAKDAVPEQTGRLKRSVRRSSRVDRRGKASAAVKMGGKKAFYAHMVEFGTKHSPPNPIMRQAFEAHKRESLNIFKAAMAKRINKVRRQRGT